MDGYKTAYIHECKEQIDVGVDFEIDTEKLGIHALTVKGLRFIKYVHDGMVMPKVRRAVQETHHGKDTDGAGPGVY